MEEKTIKELAVELTVEVTELCDTIKAKYAQSRADFIHKLEISLKECYETEYWLEILYKVHSLTEEQYRLVSGKCGTIRRKLIASITTAKKNADSSH